MDLSQQELPITAYFSREPVAKRRKSNTSASQPRSRSPNRPLPTPATSTRKRNRNGRSEVQSQRPQTSTVESEPTPSKIPKPSLGGAELIEIPLPTPSTGRRRTAKLITDDPSPSVSRRLLPEPSQVSAVSCAVPSPLRRSARLTVASPSFSVDLESPDPFPPKESVLEKPDNSYMSLKQPALRSEIMNDQSPSVITTPIIPVPSSQSQYLLHPDATPKRKRHSQCIEHVMSSQTQEEQVLTTSTPHRSIGITNLVENSPEKHVRGNAQLPCTTLKGAECDRTPTKSPTRTKKALDKLSSPLSNRSSRRNRSTPYHTPSRLGRTPRRSPRYNSRENIPPTQADDSLTESESEPDIPQLQTKVKLFTTIDPSSRDGTQVLRHSSVAHHVGPTGGCVFSEGRPAGVEDDSATEAESETEISRRIIEMSAKRPHIQRSEAKKKVTPPPPVISPLVSPATSRIAAMPAIANATRSIPLDGLGLSASDSVERPRPPSESLPSVVRDFILMFSGDESYPADFPESLRI